VHGLHVGSVTGSNKSWGKTLARYAIVN